MTVSDAAGHEATASLQISTADNEGPLVQTLDALPQTVEAGGTIDLNVSATDPDGFGQTVTETVTLRSRKKLYDFSSHTFTTCGKKTGRKGPTLSTCRQTYKPSWVSNSSYYDMTTRGYQKWTVPETGTYRIELAGAQGASKRRSGNNPKGAIVAADVPLQTGDTLLLLVGQRGNRPRGQNPPNGGGGTFVALGADRDGSGGRAGSNAAGAGGGFYGDGADGDSSGSGGANFRNGGIDGKERLPQSSIDDSLCNGGFGGGGGCDETTKSYSAGGGYSGGGPGPNLQDAGGGGSFVADEASNVATSDGQFQDKSSQDTGYSDSVTNLKKYNTGPGYVTITKK